MVRNNERKEQRLRIITVDVIRLPSPVSGETILPATKEKNPITAEALPLWDLSIFRAMAAELGRTNPIAIMNIIKMISVQITVSMVTRTIANKIENRLIPVVPIRKHNFSSNFVRIRLPAMMPIAFPPKQRLYCKGESKKCFCSRNGDEEM